MPSATHTHKKKGPLKAFCKLFPFGSELTKITTKREFKKIQFHTASSLKKTLQTTKDAYLIATDDKWRYHPDS